VQIGFMAFAVSAYVRSWLCPDLQSYSPQPMRLTAPVEKKRKEKTTPFGVNLMRSQVLYRAAQEQHQ